MEFIKYNYTEKQLKEKYGVNEQTFQKICERIENGIMAQLTLSNGHYDEDWHFVGCTEKEAQEEFGISKDKYDKILNDILQTIDRSKLKETYKKAKKHIKEERKRIKKEYKKQIRPIPTEIYFLISAIVFAICLLIAFLNLNK